MKLSELRALLTREGIQLTKSLGQNFLHDANQLRRIIEAARLTKQDKVLEVGPGLGALTEYLLEAAGAVLAIEKDARLAKVLLSRFDAEELDSLPCVDKDSTSGRPRLQLLCADALQCLKRQPRDWSGWKLVANLPYSVASPILAELACGARAPEKMVATLQLEVAKRLVAEPGNRDYGILTLLVQLDFAPHGWFKIPPGCFFPEPEVDSACVSLWRRPQPIIAEAQREVFKTIVKQAFSQRRKMMLKLLKEHWAQNALADAFKSAGLEPQVRAEQASLGQFVQLAQMLDGSALRKTNVQL
ncbi:MAG TPA: 16S rRNA (adenine(1518)-N(6)/adenine(1519)-N(6))-dimethyltransferase RsmA [Verrucomicrobiae bacterium]|nr:16S rRNA (adenine(1518)-N(6)/adenine(1519)-N(6))-dimethyltransferase RsmA [Verrucomicrobiae bacterium]